MYKSIQPFILLLKRIAFLIVLYSICRFLFYWFNHSYFSSLTFSQLALLFIYGLRFDLSAIILSNSIYIILFLLPFPFRENKIYKMGLGFLFVAVNSVAMLANCIDFVYFRFTLKRTTADALHFFNGEKANDLGRLLPSFLTG